MDDLNFDQHAREEMQADSLTEADVYTVVGDSDDIIERPDGRTLHSRMLDDGRHVTVVVETDACVVITAWVDKRRSRRRRQ